MVLTRALRIKGRRVEGVTYYTPMIPNHSKTQFLQPPLPPFLFVCLLRVLFLFVCCCFVVVFLVFSFLDLLLLL